MNYVFNVITLLGGLAMFLYGMRTMSGSIKEGTSGTLKQAMEKVTNNPLKAFLLGLAITAIIQSSTATIVITSGLVIAGVISLKQSLGIIIGANVGTTVTGQIIRFLDINSESGTFLQFFKPSTLAPVALVVGIVLIMFCTFKRANNIGNVLIGFGILFSGLLQMTGAVSDLTESQFVIDLLNSIGGNAFLAYVIGAGIAFILQSSSAAIGILQAFSISYGITFNTVYVMLVGIYLGDCVTTAIVCSINAKADGKRVGMVNILYNLGKTALVLGVVPLLNLTGVLGNLWDMNLDAGGIANTNSVFNLGCAVLLLPFVGIFERLSRIIVKNDPIDPVGNTISEATKALNPLFFSMPAFALRSCYKVLITMLDYTKKNIELAFSQLDSFDEKRQSEILINEDIIDSLTDNVNHYLTELSSYVNEKNIMFIVDQYYKNIIDFERLGDHAKNVSEIAWKIADSKHSLSAKAKKEIEVTYELLKEMYSKMRLAFERRSETSAKSLSPLADVMDAMINRLNADHLHRLQTGECSIEVGTNFLDFLTNLERLADICSNIGMSIIVRIHPELTNQLHIYKRTIRENKDSSFNDEYENAYAKYFGKLDSEDPNQITFNF